MSTEGSAKKTTGIQQRIQAKDIQVGDEIWMLKTFNEVKSIEEEGEVLLFKVSGMPWRFTVPKTSELWARDPELVPEPIPMDNESNDTKEDNDPSINTDQEPSEQ